MIEKKDNEVDIFFLEENALKVLKKGIIALLVLQVINIIYIFVNKLNMTLFDLSFSYLVIILIILREIYKNKMKIPNIILKNKKILFGDFQIDVNDVIELKTFSNSILLRYRVDEIENMVKIYSGDSKEKINEIKNAIEEYIKKF